MDYRTCFGKNNIDLLISSMQNYIKDGYSFNTGFYKTALSVLFMYYEENSEFGENDFNF